MRARRAFLPLVLGCALVAGDALTTEPAQADLVGGDTAVLGAILTQAYSSATSLLQMVQQVSAQLQLLQTMAKGLDQASFTQIVSFLNTARYSANTLTWDARSMGYQLASIDAQFQKLFPGDPPPAGTPLPQQKQTYAAWHQEVVGAAQVAARQQTSLTLLETYATQTSAVVAKSQAAAGQVASQLQLIAQLIGITNAELNVLNQTLATTGRVLTNSAAAASSEKLSRGATEEDALKNYTDPGPPVAVPTDLP